MYQLLRRDALWIALPWQAINQMSRRVRLTPSPSPKTVSCRGEHTCPAAARILEREFSAQTSQISTQSSKLKQQIIKLTSYIYYIHSPNQNPPEIRSKCLKNSKSPNQILKTQHIKNPNFKPQNQIRNLTKCQKEVLGRFPKPLGLICTTPRL